MATSTTPLPPSIAVEEYATLSRLEERPEFVEAPEYPNRAARGAITGLVLGASLWGVILVCFGVIKF